MAETFEGIVDAACALVADVPGPDLWNAAKNIHHPWVYVKKSSKEAVSLTELCPDERSLVAAFVARSFAARQVAVQLAFDLRPGAAIAQLGGLGRFGSGQDHGSIQQLVMGRLYQTISQQAERLGARERGQLVLAGLLDLDDVDDEVLAGLPAAELIAALVSGSLSPMGAELERVARHPGLADNANLVRLLDSDEVWTFELAARRLAAARYAPALDKLVARWQQHRSPAAGEALLAFGEKSGLQALVAALEARLREDEDPTSWIGPVVVAAIALDETRAKARFAQLGSDAGAGGKLALAATSCVLELLGGEPGRLERDEGWQDLAVLALSIGSLHSRAVAALRSLEGPVLKAAIGRARPAAPARAKPKLPARRNFLARYEAGEHEAVWGELVALGPLVRDPKLIEEAGAVAAAFMTKLRTNLELIVKRLNKGGYSLRAKRKALGKPKDSSKTLAALAKGTGGSVPLALAAFYTVVGPVDLSEGDDAYDDDNPFEKLGNGDPLVIHPVDELISEARDVARDNKGVPKLLHRPFLLAIAPGRDAKTDPEAGDDRPVRIRLPDDGIDATLDVAPGCVETLAAYLRRAVLRGGFLALAEREAAGLNEDLIPF